MPEYPKQAIDNNSNIYKLLKALYSILIEYHNYAAPEKKYDKEKVAKEYANSKKSMSGALRTIIGRVEEKKDHEHRISLLEYITKFCLDLQNIQLGQKALTEHQRSQFETQLTHLFQTLNSILKSAKTKSITGHYQDVQRPSSIESFPLAGATELGGAKYCRSGTIINNELFKNLNLKLWDKNKTPHESVIKFISSLCMGISTVKDSEMQAKPIAESSSSSSALSSESEESIEEIELVAGSSTDDYKSKPPGPLKQQQLMIEMGKKQLETVETLLAEKQKALQETEDLLAQKRDELEKNQSRESQSSTNHWTRQLRHENSLSRINFPVASLSIFSPPGISSMNRILTNSGSFDSSEEQNEFKSRH